MTSNEFPHPLRGALIDMDGTLYDSMPLHTRAWKTLADEIGLEATEEEFYQYEGMTGHDILDLMMYRQKGRHVSRDEAHELYGRKAALVAAAGAPPVMPGALEMMHQFRRLDVTTVLVTGSGQMSILERLNRDFPGAFTTGHMVTAHDVLHGKPSAEPFLKGLSKAGTLPSQTIAVDNAPLGVKSAAAAGLFTVGVTTGPIPKEALAKAGATIIYDSITAFARYLSTL